MGIRLAIAAAGLGLCALASAAAADITLSVSKVTFTPPPGTSWKVDTYSVGSRDVDRLIRDGAGPALVAFVDAVPSDQRCADVLSGTDDKTAVSSPAYLPPKFYPTAYESSDRGGVSVTTCADLPSGYLFAMVNYAGHTGDADFTRTAPALLSAIARAKSLDDVRSHGITCATGSQSGARFYLPAGKWTAVDAQAPDGSILDAVIRLVPSRPSIRIFYEARSGGCDGTIDGADGDDDRVFTGMYEIQRHWVRVEGRETTVWACGGLYGTTGSLFVTVMVDGTLDDLVASDYHEVVSAIFEGVRTKHAGDYGGDGCHAGFVPYAEQRDGWSDPWASRDDAQPESYAPAPTYTPPPATPEPAETSTYVPPADDTTTTTTPTTAAGPEVATADDAATAAAPEAPPAPAPATSAAADYQPDLADRRQRVSVALQLARTNTKLTSGHDASGAALAIGATVIRGSSGFGPAADVGAAIGWTRGLDFDVRAGGGAAYRGGALTIAGLAGVGADGWGALATGDDLHTVGAYAYLGGRAHLALGNLALDGSLARLVRTDPDETRFEVSASWLPPGAIGYAIGVSHIAFDGDDTKATFFWLGFVPLE
jgi:hypothetical protein